MYNKLFQHVLLTFQLANQLNETVTLVEDLDTLKDELYPLARRAAMLYAIIRSLQSIHNEYQFSLDYFVKLFDEAVGGELPEEFGHGLVTEEVLNLYYNI